MRLLLAGDFHCDLNHAGYISQIAKNQDISRIVQVGDFGYWPHTSPEYVPRMDETLAKRGQTLVWIPGNHENYDALYALEDVTERTPEGFWKVAENIFYAPRGLRWTWDDTTFLALGGAHSIDKMMRLGLEQRSGRPRTQWWPQELLTDEDVARAISGDGRVDVVISHDMPVGCDDVFTLYKTDPEDHDNRRRVKRVVDHVRPKTLVHGHYHIKREMIYRTPDGWPVQIIGLDCNFNPHDSWIVLETNVQDPG